MWVHVLWFRIVIFVFAFDCKMLWAAMPYSDYFLFVVVVVLVFLEGSFVGEHC